MISNKKKKRKTSSLPGGMTVDAFLDNYQNSIDNRNAALFIGAGLSVPSGFVSWKELLRDIAEELGLDVDRENDLIAIAQYHVNHSGGRGAINQRLIQEFIKDTKLTKNHEIISDLPIGTIWTTNYDKLLEEAYSGSKKRYDVKIVEANLALTLPKRDVVIYKMHGDISMPHEAVLTKEDYELYHVNRGLFSAQLQGDLVSKTFLFLGYSLQDPNIDYILSRVRALVGKNRREHYWITKGINKPERFTPKQRADYEYNMVKFQHRVTDLKSYGIRAVLVNNYNDITDILSELHRRVHRKNIFVSGSAEEYGSFGRERTEKLSRRLGAEIIKRGYNLVSGFGLGIGGAVTLGAMEALYNSGSHIDERTVLRPFPQEFPSNMDRATFWRTYREGMISKSGFSIFIAGNKLNDDGSVVVADGVKEEFEIALQKMIYPIPIGVTGYAAQEIWELMSKNLGSYFGGISADIKESFNALNNKKLTEEKITNAAFDIIKKIHPK